LKIGVNDNLVRVFEINNFPERHIKTVGPNLTDLIVNFFGQGVNRRRPTLLRSHLQIPELDMKILMLPLLCVGSNIDLTPPFPA
jgi:hypothetical protein